MRCHFSLLDGSSNFMSNNTVVKFDEGAHLRFQDLSALGSALLKQIAQCKSWIVKEISETLIYLNMDKM